MQLPDLKQLLEFRHSPSIQSFVRERGWEPARANDLFVDMLKYLWGCRKHAADRSARPNEVALDFSFVMHEEMREIDNMWHTFILYTRDYTDFCHEYFGEYLHHQPDIALGPAPAAREFSTEMEKYLSYVYDNLGEPTVRKWFAMHL